MSQTSPSDPGAGGHQLAAVRDLYQVLQVDPLASRDIIAEAYWALVRKAKTLRSQDQTGDQTLNQLNVAYATLVDSDLRDSYNRTLPPHRLDGGRSIGGGQRPLRHRLLGSRHLPGRENKRNLYQILQVDPNAEHELIVASYACLRQQCGEGIWSGRPILEALDELAEAFSVLSDPEQRASYDANFPDLRVERESAPEPSPASVADEPGIASTDSESKETAVIQALAGTAKPPPAAIRSHLSRKLIRFLGRILVVAGRGARYTGRHLYRGARWLVIVVLAPAARKLVTASGNYIDALLKWLELRSPPPLTDDMDDAIRERLFANNELSLQGPLPATAPRNSEQPGIALARLVIRDGPHADSTFILTERPISLGADPRCDVILEAQGDNVAPLHARIWYRAGRFMFHQIADREKILVGTRPLTWGILEDGDELRISHHRLTFELTSPNEAVHGTQPEDDDGHNKP